MDEKNWLRILALLLGVPMLGLVLSRPAAEPMAPAPEVAAVVEAGPPAVEPSALAVAEIPAPLARCQERARALGAAGYLPTTLVATIPDPVDSLHGRTFDLLVGAIRRGLESVDFVTEGHCLPWSRPGEAAGDDGDLHREEPGWLVFRRDPAPGRPPRLVTVLLVGESPPWGPQPAAMARALDHACALQGAPAAQALAPPKLLAPTFSASTFALGMILRSWGNAEPELARSCFHGSVEVVSGTATGSDNEGTLFRTLAAQGSEVPVLRPDFRSLATASTVLRDCALDFYLPERLGVDTRRHPQTAPGSPEVALLVESSLYGRDFQGADRNLLVVPFPLNVSSLRVEYDKEKSGSRPAEALPEVGPRLLPFAAGSEVTARDALRLFDPQGTTRTLDLELANLLSAVARRRIQAVGIVATNVRDVLFLAEALRRSAPDVRLFTFEADLLLAHPDFLGALRGTIVISSNPLASPDPYTERAGSSGQLIQFGSDAAQGVFRAVRALVEPTAEPSADWQDVWVSVVGRARLVVLKQVRVPRAGGSCVEAARQVHGRGQETELLPFRPPRGWTLLVTALTVALAGGLAAGLWRALRGHGRHDLLSWELLTVGEDGRSGLPAHTQRLRHALLLLVPVVALLPYIVLTGPVFLAAGGRVALLRAVGGGGVLLLIATLCFLLWGLLRRTRRDLAAAATQGRGRLATLRIAWPALAALAGLVSALLLARLAMSRIPTEKADPVGLTLVLERLISFGSGVSPLVPCLILLLVLLGWLVLNLWRYHALERLAPDARLSPAGLPAVPERFWRAQRELRWALDPAGWLAHPALTARSLVAWAVLVGAPLLYLACYYRGRLDPLLRGFEAPEFDWIASLLFGLASVAVCEAGLSLWRGWQALRTALAWLLDLRFDPGAADGWLGELEAVAHPGADGGAEIRERRARAYSELCQELGRSGVPGPLGGLLPREPAVPAEPELAALWLGIANRAANREEGADDSAEPPRDPAAAGALLTAERRFFAWESAYLARLISARLVLLLRFLTVGVLALLVAVVAYPFEPERMLSFYTGGLVALAVVVSLAFVVQAEKNPMLARLAGTQANQINWHRTLLQRLGLYAGLPLLSLLTSQLPELQRLLSQWVEPLAKVFQ